MPDLSHPQRPTARGLVRPLVLVGLMGAGKTTVGRRVAQALRVTFADSDEAIESAAGMAVAEIFEAYGETEFRALERRVIKRLFAEPDVGVIALGGGAFIDPDTRSLVLEGGHVVWLKAPIEALIARTARRPGKRPLLAKGDPRDVLTHLMIQREPIYALAHDTVVSGDLPLVQVVAQVAEKAAKAAPPP